jgi:hypothetical protein
MLNPLRISGLASMRVGRVEFAGDCGQWRRCGPVGGCLTFGVGARGGDGVRWGDRPRTDRCATWRRPRPVGRGGRLASAGVTTSEDRQKLAETIKRHLEIEDRILQALRSAELPPPDEFKALVREQDELSRTINELSEKLFT